MGVLLLPLLVTGFVAAQATDWVTFWSQAKTLSFPSGSARENFPPPETGLPTTYGTLLFDADDQRIGLVRTLASSIRRAGGNPRLPFVVFTTELLTKEQMKSLKNDHLLVRNLTAIDLPWKLGEKGHLVDVRTGFVSENSPVPDFHRNWRGVFTKLQLFDTKDFGQLVVLDYDILVQEPLSTQLLPLCPSTAHLCMQQEDSGYGNGGVLVIRPSKARHRDLIKAFEALQHSGVILKYAEQDFWNLYASAQNSQFLSLMQLPNNCPGHCGNFLAPFHKDCYLTNPGTFPLLHFCGAAKPSICTRTDMDAIWGDFCDSEAAKRWTSVFYELQNPCGTDKSCVTVSRRHAVVGSFDLAARARHRADLLTYEGPTGGCCGAAICIASDFPQTNCTDLGGSWNSSGVDCSSCGTAHEPAVNLPGGTVLAKVDLSASGLSGALLYRVRDGNELPALPSKPGESSVFAFTLELIVGGEEVPGGQLPAGKYIEILLSSSAFSNTIRLVIYRYDVPTNEWVDSITDCDAAIATEPVFVEGAVPSLRVRLCHLSDFQATTANITADDADDKPDKKKPAAKQPLNKPGKKPSKQKTPSVAKAPEPKKDPKKQQKAPSAPKDVKVDPKPKDDGAGKKKGKLLSFGIGLGAGVAGVTAVAGGLTVWACKRQVKAKKPAGRPYSFAVVRV